MPKIESSYGEIVVDYAGRNNVVAQVSWNNPETKKALEQLFALKPREYLSAVIITAAGIRAEIKTL